LQKVVTKNKRIKTEQKKKLTGIIRVSKFPESIINAVFNDNGNKLLNSEGINAIDVP
jgi:hypothetical protein